MFAPLPPVGRFTEGRLIVREDVPRLFVMLLFFFFLVSTASAKGVGGGGAIGAG